MGLKGWQSADGGAPVLTQFSTRSEHLACYDVMLLSCDLQQITFHGFENNFGDFVQSVKCRGILTTDSKTTTKTD